jgi:hypothetical protein
MSTPNLTVTAEPFESGKVVFLPLAPKTANDKQNAQLSLKLFMTNNESKKLTVTQLKISFVGPPSVSDVTIPIDVKTTDANGQPLTLPFEIESKKTGVWFFATEMNILLPVPAPGTIKLSLTCKDFTSPATVSFPLAAHKSPTPAQSFSFPARPNDFRVGEYWVGRSTTHGPAGDGGQMFAYDMGVMAFDQSKNQWSQTLPNTAGDKNEHWRIWGKPIYAMADGTVVDFRNDIPSNTKMGKQVPTPNPVEGNHFYIQHGDELMLYAHFQAGTLNSNLTTKGKAVKEGDFLGLAGNSGNSTNPHLHIHTIQATKPWQGPARPLPFHDIHVIDQTALHPPDPSGAWVKADDQGLPSAASAIWPAGTKPTWYPPGWGELARHAIPESAYQTEFDHIVSSGYRLVWIDGYDVNGKTFFNVIFRASDGVAWSARHGLSGSDYQKAFDEHMQKGFRLAHIESYLSGGSVRYAPIFVKSAGAAFTAYHGRTADQHQQLFDDLIKDGWRPVNVTAVSPGGARMYAALYEKKDVGSFFVKSFMTPPEYQTQFDANVQAGRKLAYLNAYTHQGSPRIIAIWQSKAGSPFVARHGLTSAQYQAEFDKNLANGFLTRAVTGYEENGGQRFAAYWSK